MTTDELKALVNSEHPWNAQREAAAKKVENDSYVGQNKVKDEDLLAYYSIYMWSSEAPVTQNSLSYRLRWLLARRLMREGRGGEALAYFPSHLRPVSSEYLDQIKLARSEKSSRAERATRWWNAACLARTRGLELMGTEREPDNAMCAGP